MKNLKLLFTALPVLALTCFIYFSTSGFSNHNKAESNKNYKTISNLKEGPNTTIDLTIHLTDLGSNHCLSGDYRICVNGGSPQAYYSDEFEIKVTCGEYVSFCVVSSTGCTGSWYGYVPCPDNPGIYIDLSPTNPECSCSF
ncbi:MAG: hypothetical protein J0M18_05830 [Ignavibacteria bacterium]|jgi:hypothetical protein|nr:hypothetical protein [Ignavibacteria bacterium]